MVRRFNNIPPNIAANMLAPTRGLQIVVIPTPISTTPAQCADSGEVDH